MTDHLLRQLAPITAAAWEAIEAEVKPRLKAHLAARKLVDFEGPLGWDHSATNLGRAHPIAGPSAELTALQRAVLPLVEVRVGFALSRIDEAEAQRVFDLLAELDQLGELKVAQP